MTSRSWHKERKKGWEYFPAFLSGAFYGLDIKAKEMTSPYARQWGCWLLAYRRQGMGDMHAILPGK